MNVLKSRLPANVFARYQDKYSLIFFATETTFDEVEIAEKMAEVKRKINMSLRFGVVLPNYDDWAENEFIPLLLEQKRAWQAWMNRQLDEQEQQGLNLHECCLLYSGQIAKIDRAIKGRDPALEIYQNHCDAIMHQKMQY